MSISILTVRTSFASSQLHVERSKIQPAHQPASQDATTNQRHAKSSTARMGFSRHKNPDELNSLSSLLFPCASQMPLSGSSFPCIRESHHFIPRQIYHFPFISIVSRWCLVLVYCCWSVHGDVAAAYSESESVGISSEGLFQASSTMSAEV